MRSVILQSFLPARDVSRSLDSYQNKLFPTFSEGFGMVLLEAIACSLESIVTFTSGPLESAQAGHDGLIVSARDPRSIMRALEHLIAFRTLLDWLRRKAYAKVQACNWNLNVSQTLRLYAKYIRCRV
jgi:glycosyltransferase involved in cell wall biosynthesis